MARFKKKLLSQPEHYSRLQMLALVLLRVLIGWHFLYEGVTKLLNPHWSSTAYLAASEGIFSALFASILANPTLLQMVDLLNVWGLILIGAGLIAGFFTRSVTIAGIILLFLYYITNPPLVGLTAAVPGEESYLLVNKVLIEMAALLVLALFPSGRYIGLDVLISNLSRS